MLKNHLQKLIDKKDLTAEESAEACDAMLKSPDSPQSAAFLALLSAKSETSEELYGLVKTLHSNMQTITPSCPVLDIVGTGGDGANTVNISTSASILAASAGVKIIKHGNRAVSSRCGSADVLEKLGVNIECSPNTTINCLNHASIGFCFAPLYHSAFKRLKQLRRDLGIPTCLNIVGPLLNPARADFLLVGVRNVQLLNILADVVINLGIKRALIFHGSGLDELSPVGPNNVIEIIGLRKRSYILDALDFGFPRCQLNDLCGGDPTLNAEKLLEVFAGKKCAIADAIIFNAAMAIFTYGITSSIANAIQLATTNLINGDAMNTLRKLIKISNEV